MKKIMICTIIAAAFLSACGTTNTVTDIKSVAYKGMYDEKPLAILLMPPINRSTNVEAKEYFHSTLNVPLANAGYYVIPTFLSMEILKKESAYDAELFLDSPLNRFGEVFGADLALFTIIHKWDKSHIAGSVDVSVEYILKSTRTNEVLYTRTGDITYNTSVSSGTGGLIGVLADMAATAINTAATRYIDVARACNTYTFQDLPAGKYSPSYGADANEFAGEKVFKATLSNK
ncbi:MAG TPA: hypothetical protein DEF88_10835 [Porphyromonadaceae bacterium]|jgi:hypothetical protein|nr:hypothetical protein [Porphyromonadaceae bacterium]HBX20930.1 hypothetical protein [Porphyromonadaceae bacterium]HCM19669.1 hypothetical protein [Porphyromonadaceae bacterium]